MPGTLNVGGHNIITHSGTSGAGDVTVNVQDRLVLDSSGNVGIGNSTTNSKLTVADGTAGAKITLKTGTNLSNSVQGLSFYDRKGTAQFPSDPGQLAGYVYLERDGIYAEYDLTFGTAYGTSSTALERMRIDSSGNLKFDSGFGSVATAYGCRAWVNFNGTGTPTIRNSGNVSSITDYGTGNQGVNFQNAMPSTTYCAIASNDLTSNGAWYVVPYMDAYTTTSIRYRNFSHYDTNATDCVDISVAVFM